MSEMKYLNKETLGIFTELLFSRSISPKRIWIIPEDDENDKVKLSPYFYDDIRTYNLEDVFCVINEISLHIELVEDKEKKLTDFLNEYISHFKNNELEVGLPVFLRFEEHFDWIYKILRDSFVGNKMHFVVSTNYSTLKESYPNFPQNIKLLEFLLFLELEGLIEITDCDSYINDFSNGASSDVKIKLSKTPDEIIAELKNKTQDQIIITQSPVEIILLHNDKNETIKVEDIEYKLTKEDYQLITMFIEKLPENITSKEIAKAFNIERNTATIKVASFKEEHPKIGEYISNSTRHSNGYKFNFLPQQIKTY